MRWYYRIALVTRHSLYVYKSAQSIRKYQTSLPMETECLIKLLANTCKYESLFLLDHTLRLASWHHASKTVTTHRTKPESQPVKEMRVKISTPLQRDN